MLAVAVVARRAAVIRVVLRQSMVAVEERLLFVLGTMGGGVNEGGVSVWEGQKKKGRRTTRPQPAAPLACPSGRNKKRRKGKRKRHGCV